MLNLNNTPYYDDFDPTKGYYKILFNPSRPVQARELTQLQTQLQSQLKYSGDFTFQNGTMVVPGHVFYDNTVSYLKIAKTDSTGNLIEPLLASMVGSTITGGTNGITATLIWYDVASGLDTTTLYIKYTSAAGSIKTFQSGENFSSSANNQITGRILTVSDYTGSAAICSIGAGVFYVNGYFVAVPSETITVSKYNINSSAVVGLNYTENIVTASQDSSLYDNASGFTNFGAEGADRLHIGLNLSVQPYTYQIPNIASISFIELLKINSGTIEKLSNNTQFAAIESLVAKRDFDTNGNYVTAKFNLSATNYRNNNRGQWTSSTPYLGGDIVSNAGINYIAISQGYSGTTVPNIPYGIISDGSVYWLEIPSASQFLNDGSILVSSSNISDHLVADSNMNLKNSAGSAFVNGYEYSYPTPSTNIITKSQTATQISQAQMYNPVGKYIKVTNIKGSPNIATDLTTVSLVDVSGAIIGTARVRSIEYDSTNITTVYKLFVFDVKVYNGYFFEKDVNSIVSTAFTCDIVPSQSIITGSVSSTGTATTGYGTFFSVELNVGDRILIGNTITKIVSINSNNSITTSSGVSAPAGTVITKCTSVITSVGSYLAPLTYPSIKSVRSSTGSVDMSYVISKPFTFTATSTTQNINLSGGETFLPTGHITIENTGILSTSLPVAATYVLSSGNTVLTISGLTSTSTYDFIGLVNRTSNYAKEKIKTIASNSFDIFLTGVNNFTSKVITLPHSDIIMLVKVLESGDPVSKTVYQSAGETDITQFYTLDNGQNSEFYGLGKITTNRVGSRPIRIVYTYFQHSVGDYFSADSYAVIPKSLIGTTAINGVNYFLPDFLDFRSSISPLADFSVANGASVSEPILSTSTMSTSFSYYNPRVDSIGLDDSGNQVYNVNSQFKTGIGMQLATINVAPYTFRPSKDVTFVDNQIVTYKMSDIKNIDKRLTSVEDYVILDSLEKSAVNTSIIDQYGLQSTTNGFFVDGFKDFNLCDLSNIDYKSSVDFTNNVCQALSTIDGITLSEPTGTSDASRLAKNYKITGSQLSLDYKEVPLISQTIASDSMRIQPFAVLNFNGNMNLYPAYDAYVDNISNTVHTTNILTPQVINISKTSYTKVLIGSVNMGDWYSYRYATVKGAKSVSTTNKTLVTLASSNISDTVLRPATVRERTLVLSSTGLIPNSNLTVFFNNTLASGYSTTATEVVISGLSAPFVDSSSNMMSDNITLRNTGIASYDNINYGEVVQCSSGSGVVIKVESVYDALTLSYQTKMYLTNVKGTISGTISGLTSGATATTVSVITPTNNFMSNSNGSSYITVKLPVATIPSGVVNIMVSNSTSPDPASATSLAEATYTTSGVINMQTTNVTYNSQNVTTITTTN